MLKHSGLLTLQWMFMTFIATLSFAKETSVFIPSGTKQLQSKANANEVSNFISSASQCISPVPEVNCFRPYSEKNGKRWIIELCQRSGKYEPGIYFGDQSTFSRSEWFDPKLFEWACKETCDECSYTVTFSKDGKISEFVYRYRINLEEGKFRVAVKKGRLKTLEKKMKDLGP
jgi:hypothetical protein